MSVTSRVPLIGWLFPSPGEPGASIARRIALRLIVSLTMANLIGAAVVFVFLGFVLPLPDDAEGGPGVLANLIAVAIYVGFGTVIGTIWGAKRLMPIRRWLRADQPASPRERARVLRAPFQIVGVHAVLWGAAAILFGALNWAGSPELARRVGTTVLLGGLTTCAIAYLLTERGLRTAAGRALAEGLDEQRIALGVRGRALLAWILGAGVPFIGVVMVALSRLVERDFNANEIAVAVLALAGVGLTIGLYVSTLATRAVADPIKEVSAALAQVERGNLDVEVPVYDGSEIGMLQAGFNRMVAGLREREQLHDLFGRHVGEDVARKALEQEVELGGEVREVSVLFVDLVGSTELASERPPQEVVEILNAFFAVAIDVVHKHGGSINKFEGDAALAVFGAPNPLGDHADKALAAGRVMCERFDRELEAAEAGIGVSSGEVVAGNIGGEERFEYTVIGDPVNEAARLTELAKTKGGILASGSTLERAGDNEASRWELGESVELRGRAEKTRLARLSKSARI